MGCDPKTCKSCEEEKCKECKPVAYGFPLTKYNGICIPTYFSCLEPETDGSCSMCAKNYALSDDE